MKSILKIFVFSLIPLMFFSCGIIDEVPVDVTLPVTLVKRLPVAATDTNEKTYTVTLDATSDPEVQKHLSKIKSYEITELLFGIEKYFSPTEDEIYFNGTIGFSKASDSQASSTCPVSNIPITHWAGTQDFPIGTCNDILDEISTVFADENAVKVYLTGTFTKAPLSFDLKVTVNAIITASPL